MMKISHIIDIWARSQVLNTGPTWEGQPEPTALAEKITEDWIRYRSDILTLLRHSNPLVVAHALLCARIAQEPISVIETYGIPQLASRVTIQEGSFRKNVNINSLYRAWFKIN